MLSAQFLHSINVLLSVLYNSILDIASWLISFPAIAQAIVAIAPAKY